MRQIQKTLAFLFGAIASATINPAYSLPIRVGEPASTGIASPSASEHKWHIFKPSEGHFSVLMPSKPKYNSHPANPSSSINLFVSRWLDASYAVQYDDRPSKSIQLLGAEKILALTRHASLKAFHGTRISERHLQMNGYPGGEIIIARSLNRIVIMHDFLVGNRMYRLYVVRFTTNGETPDTDKFLNSFTLIPANSPDENSEKAL